MSFDVLTIHDNPSERSFGTIFFTGALSEGRVTLPTAGVWDGAGVL